MEWRVLAATPQRVGEGGCADRRGLTVWQGRAGRSFSKSNGRCFPVMPACIRGDAGAAGAKRCSVRGVACMVHLHSVTRQHA
jgi:hypothetical protein